MRDRLEGAAVAIVVAAGMKDMTTRWWGDGAEGV
jgi:hypothetical protein